MLRRTFLTTLGLSSLLTRWPWLHASDIPDEAKTTIWVTKDGREFRICDMSDDHLRRTIFYLARRHEALYGDYGWLVPVNWTGTEPTVPTIFEWEPHYAVMLREATRRRLTWI